MSDWSLSDKSTTPVNDSRMSSNTKCVQCGAIDIYCRCDPVSDAHRAKYESAKEEEYEYCRAFLYHSEIKREDGWAPLAGQEPREFPCVTHEELIQSYIAFQRKVGLACGRYVFSLRNITCDFCMECDLCDFELKEVIRHYEWPFAQRYWYENFASTYVQFNPLVGPTDPEISFLTWKKWQEYKQTHCIVYDLKKK